MTDYAGFKVGGATFPLTASITNTPLRDADPSVYFALDFIGAMLIHHMGARFAAELVKVQGLKSITSVVGSRVGYDPGPYLTQNQVKFPLLSLSRLQSTYAEETISFGRETCDLSLQYILPPLTAGQAERLIPCLRAVSAILMDRIELGMDPSYTPPGGTLGGYVWRACGLESIALTSGRFISYSDGGDLCFPAWQANITISERSDWVAPDFEAFAGSDVHEDLHDTATNTTIADVVVMATDIG